MAANSTKLISDLNTINANGPSSVTTANSIAAAGVIIDYPGNVQGCALDLANLKQRLIALQGNTDAGTDATNLALLTGIIQILV